MKVTFIGMSLVFILVFIPLFANASVFGFGLFFKKQDDSAQNLDDHNSQTVPVLQAAVNFDPNPAKGGGDITIVDNSALLAETGLTGSLVEVNERQTTGQISIYEVREGDTLSQIAEMFGVSVNTIRWANDFDGAISPGQTLVILPVTGVKHVVKSGGTVEDIAELYSGDPREIALFNGISVKTELKPGDEILVPHGAIEAAPEKTKSNSSGKTVVHTQTSSSSSSASADGYFIRPISGGYKSQGIHGYNAVDLAAPVGTPVRAAASGTVIISRSSGWNGGYGSYIVIKHDNGTQSLYAHLSADYVVVGQRVSQGENIGAVGNTGKSTGAHIHFEIRGARNPF